MIKNNINIITILKSEEVYLGSIIKALDVHQLLDSVYILGGKIYFYILKIQIKKRLSLFTKIIMVMRFTLLK